MKKWKKTHRERKKNKSTLFKIKFTPEEYFKYNEYRISHSYSWDKFMSVAINNACKLYGVNNK